MYVKKLVVAQCLEAYLSHCRRILWGMVGMGTVDGKVVFRVQNGSLENREYLKSLILVEGRF